MRLSKRLIMIIILCGFTGYVVIYAVNAEMENLAIAAMTSIAAALTYYLHAETKRPSKK
ncbi:MAG: hypothetical protein ACOC2U_01025 [bacterium]